MARAQAQSGTAAKNKKKKKVEASIAALKEKAAADTSGETSTDATPDSPLLDMSDAAVKKLIKQAKQRGFVTYDELNEVLPSAEVSSEQIEDTWAMLAEMGINVVESEEETEDTAESAERAQTGLPMKVERASEPVDRTDDPVRMYLREMGSVELLSREGEIAIAKRIEAGREAMIHGLCESPLTFQAIIIWRDELNEAAFCCATSLISKPHMPVLTPRRQLPQHRRPRRTAKPPPRRKRSWKNPKAGRIRAPGRKYLWRCPVTR